MSEHLHLGMLKKGQTAIITGISPYCKSEVKQRLLDLGFVKNTEITVQNISPLNDPVSYTIHNTQISLRRTDSLHILIATKNNEQHNDKSPLRSL